MVPGRDLAARGGRGRLLPDCGAFLGGRLGQLPGLATRWPKWGQLAPFLAYLDIRLAQFHATSAARPKRSLAILPRTYPCVECLDVHIGRLLSGPRWKGRIDPRPRAAKGTPPRYTTAPDCALAESSRDALRCVAIRPQVVIPSAGPRDAPASRIGRPCATTLPNRHRETST
jgi:hypothetical protein